MLPFHIGTSELVIILVIIVLLFGVGRIGRLGADFGKAVSEFRKAFSEDEKDKKSPGL